MTLKDKLKACGKDMSFTELAKLLGYAKSTISMVNTGKLPMTARMAELLSLKVGGTQSYWYETKKSLPFREAHDKLLKNGFRTDKYRTYYNRGSVLISRRKTITWIISSNNDPKVEVNTLPEAVELLGELLED